MSSSVLLFLYHKRKLENIIALKVGPTGSGDTPREYNNNPKDSKTRRYKVLDGPNTEYLRIMTIINDSGQQMVNYEPTVVRESYV